MISAQQWVEKMQLKPHPEGGFYSEVYRSALVLSHQSLPQAYSGSRHASTAIYYLLQEGDFSAFHRIVSDEIWHHYDGGVLELYSIDKQGVLHVQYLGKSLSANVFPFLVIPGDTWFAAQPQQNSVFVLAGCTVAPGFDFVDFEMGSREQLLTQFPQHTEKINLLTRG